MGQNGSSSRTIILGQKVLRIRTIILGRREYKPCRIVLLYRQLIVKSDRIRHTELAGDSWHSLKIIRADEKNA